jgi:hypothetical protein
LSSLDAVEREVKEPFRELRSCGRTIEEEKGLSQADTVVFAIFQVYW